VALWLGGLQQDVEKTACHTQSQSWIGFQSTRLERAPAVIKGIKHAGMADQAPGNLGSGGVRETHYLHYIGGKPPFFALHFALPFHYQVMWKNITNPEK
jgi:hypothetical protein